MALDNWRKNTDCKALAREIERRFSLLERQREPYHALWNSIADHMAPSLGAFGQSDPTHPIQPEAQISDTTARRSSKILSAGLLSFLTSPAQDWFRLTLADKDLADYKPVRLYLQEVEEMSYDALSRSDFYAKQHIGYHTSGLFGVKSLYVDETPLGDIRFLSRPLQELYLAQDHLGQIDTVCRKFKLTAHQAVSAFGREALEEAKAANLIRTYDDSRQWKGGSLEQTWELLHWCGPMNSLDGLIDESLSKSFPVASVYLLRGDTQDVLHVGGYDDLPFLVDRWMEHPATPYAADWPGLAVIADSKMVNEMKNLLLESGQLSAAPPLWVPDDGFVGRISMQPRAINYYNKTAESSLADFGPMNVGGDPRFSVDLLSMSRKDIQEAFFVDLFLAVRQRIEQGGAPTATEITEIASERMFLLGPMLYGQHRSLDRMFDRLFVLLSRRGVLPPPPDALLQSVDRGDIQKIDIDYISPLAQAQKEAQTKSMARTYQYARGLAEVAPSVLDNFDHDNAVRLIAEQQGLPASALRSKEEVLQIRQQRQQQMAAQQQAQLLAETADTYPSLAKAPEDGSPAGALIQALGQQRRRGGAA